MDMITQTSLEALLLKATNSHNQNIDTAAVEAFCALVNKEKDGAHIGVKVIAARLPSGDEKEILQTLNILDICMSRCGSHFQSEVGKFRFLNEMIKLVSPKYLGSHTPLIVKQKVLQLMYIWTLDYPKETKIKEAYDMLRKQGVVKEIPNPNITLQTSSNSNNNIVKKKQADSIFQDEEKSKILQKLLQSKDPEDIQAANWLIKSMVKEDDKRAEMKSRRISELESVQNNVRLLNEMLDSYKPGISSRDELDLIRELHQSCERLRPNIMKLATEAQQGEEILEDVLQASDEMSQVLTKFNLLIKGQHSKRSDSASKLLLDLENGGVSAEAASSNKKNGVTAETPTKSEIDVLTEIFTNTSIPDAGDVLQPTTISQNDKAESIKCNTNSKLHGLEELDVLSEHLFKENLQPSKQSGFNRNQEKIPMNLLTKSTDIPQQQKATATTTKELDSLNLDLSYLINKPKDSEAKTTNKTNNIDASGDDVLVDISDEKMLEANDFNNHQNEPKQEQQQPQENKQENDNSSSKVITEKCNNINKNDLKLNDITVNLDEIKPSNVPPMVILNERNGITITLHFGKNKPREDVKVFVVTTVNKNQMPLTNYLFQAVVPKGFKLKLQPASSTELSAHNPFLPPAAITQIMLIACPDNVQISFKFIVSYVMDDETYTEMGEVEDLSVN